RRGGGRDARKGAGAAPRDRARRRGSRHVSAARAPREAGIRPIARCRVLIVDNYDSFTYNLAQAFGALGADVRVLRADDPALPRALDAGIDRLVISPGPGRPEVAGRSPALAREAPERGIPTLGVCLGLQCAAVAFGAQVVRAPEPRHGKTSPVPRDGRGVFTGVPDPTDGTATHALLVHRVTLPGELGGEVL